MSTYNIGIIVGSLRKESFNRKLAQALMKLAPEKLECEIISIADVPLYNQDNDSSPPAAAMALKKAVASKVGIIFVTPEYNRSIPGVLKNAIDTASRPYGDNSWAGKAAGIVGTSPGAIGTAVAQEQLRSCVSGFLDMPTLGQPEVYLQFKDGLIDEKGDVSNVKTREFLQKWMDAYTAWVAKIVG